MPFLVIFTLITLLVVCGPLVIIWSLNTLFPVLGIGYTFWTWLAALCLFGATAGGIKK
jgi:hypothetical protein